MSEYISKEWVSGEVITADALNNLELGIRETKKEVCAVQINVENRDTKLEADIAKTLKESKTFTSEAVNELTKDSDYSNFAEIEKDILAMRTKQEKELETQYEQLTQYTDSKVAELINGAPTTLDTLKEIADAMAENEDVVEALNESIGTKASEEEFSTHTKNGVVHITETERSNWEDAHMKKHIHENKSILDNTTASFTLEEKEKLAGIANGANKMVVDSTLNSNSENPVQNKVIFWEIEALKKSVSDGKTIVAEAITDNGVNTATDANFETMANNIDTVATNKYNQGIAYADGRTNTESANYQGGYNAGVTATKKGTAVAENVLAGKTFTNSSDVEIQGTMPDSTASRVFTPSTASQYYTIPKGYHDGSGKVTVNPAPTSLIDGDATVADVLRGKTFFVDSYTKKTGTMINNGAKTASLNCGESYTIPKGYHDGSGKVTANSLASQTEGTATAENILLNKTAYVNGVEVTGSMKSNSPDDTKLNCGETYGIPSGYHTGGGRVIVNSLASQTEATATAIDIAEGKTAWVNGVEIIGTAQQVPNGKIWTQSNITSGNFISFDYLNGVYVAGSEGSGLWYSEDGVMWTQSNVTSGTFKALCHNGDNTWMAGDCSDSALGIYSSNDGKTWYQERIGICHDIKFANGIWVAAVQGKSGGGGMFGLYYSTAGTTNGTSWTQYYSGKVTDNCFSVCYGNGIWVASSNTGKYYSTDGRSWTRADNVVSIYDTILYGNGVFVAIKKGSTGAVYSTNGKAWTSISNISYSVKCICYAKGVWLIGTGTARYYSDDGKAWTMSNPGNSYPVYYYANGIFLSIVGVGLRYSTDGKSWTSVKESASVGFKCIFYADGIWIASNGEGIYYSKAS